MTDVDPFIQVEERSGQRKQMFSLVSPRGSSALEVVQCWR